MKEEQYPGSRWWKFDFHNHTPASSDYDRTEIGTLQERDWLLAYMQKGIDCVAVTDHNTSGWVEKLQVALAALKQETPPPAGFHPMVLFPGAEITTNDSLHILAIFAPDTKKSTIDGLLEGKITISNPAKTNAEQMVSESASNVIDAIHEKGGLAIAAHVERPCGLLQGNSSSGKFEPKTAERTMDDVLPKLNGLEFQSLHCDAYRHFAAHISHLAHVAGSDAHARTMAGSRFTWVKMSRPSFDGLRLALHDPESAIRRSDEAGADFHAFPEQWIASLTLKNLHLRRNGHGPLALDFNPAYNAIIGGRGSGKSTVLECLRLAFARENELEKLGKDSEIWKSFEDFRKVYVNRNTPGMMLNDTEICAEVVKGRGASSQRFQYIWRKQANGKSSAQVMRWENTAWQATGLDEAQARDFFPIKIFSQKQILALANNPQALLEHIDNAIPEQKKRCLAEFERCKTALLAARLRVRTLKKELATEPALLLEYKEASRKALVFKNANFGNLLKAYQRATQQKRAMEDFHQLLANDIAALQAGIEQAANLANTEPNQFLAETPSEMSEREQALALKSRLLAEYEKIVAAAATMQTLLNTAKEVQTASHWQQENTTHLQAYQNETARLKNEGINSANEAAIAVATEEKLGKQIEQIKLLKADIESAEKAVAMAAQALNQCRATLTAERTTLLDQLLEENDMLKVTLRSMASTKDEVERLRGLLRLPSNNFSAAIWQENDEAQTCGVLWDIANVEDATLIPDRLAEFKTALQEMHEKHEKHEKQHDNKILSTSFRADLIKRIEALPAEVFDELACWFPEDEVILQYRHKKDDSYKKINQASAGQKTAAMLSFLLMHGDEPLLLDQPEDDLDNALVSELVVEQLRKNKAHRQLLVVTHNANIVVNADADLVMTMDFKNGQINSDSRGGLQETSVRQNICQVMEGGEQAFRQRYKRILKDLKE